jgi:hypothetical protein
MERIVRSLVKHWGRTRVAPLKKWWMRHFSKKKAPQIGNTSDSKERIVSEVQLTMVISGRQGVVCRWLLTISPSVGTTRKRVVYFRLSRVLDGYCTSHELSLLHIKGRPTNGDTLALSLLCPWPFSPRQCSLPQRCELSSIM